MKPVCGGPTGAFSNVTTFAPAVVFTVAVAPLNAVTIDPAAPGTGRTLFTTSFAGTASVILIREPICTGSAMLQPGASADSPAVAVTRVVPIVKLYCLCCNSGLALHLQTFSVAAAGALVIVTCVSWPPTTSTLTVPVRKFSLIQFRSGTTTSPVIAQFAFAVSVIVVARASTPSGSEHVPPTTVAVPTTDVT